ncbi:GntR family transcriptional regulator [Vibrio sp. DNB22_10_4]
MNSNLSTVTYNRIRNLIVSGALPMGSKISESTLQKKLESTKAPIRDAIKRLSAEGLLDVRPKSGTYVFSFSQDDFQDFLQFRLLLEESAVGIIVSSRENSGELVGQLEAIHDQMIYSLEMERVYEYIRLDNEFHNALILACGNRYIISSYATIAPRMSAVSVNLTNSGEHLFKGLEQHKALIEAIKTLDQDSANRVLGSHILPEFGSFWELENIVK